MPLFELENVKLGGVEGPGYAFSKRTVFGKTFQGIVFVDTEDDVEALQDEDDLMYEGTVYHQRRSRGPRKDEDAFEVEITSVTSTGMGERISFEAVENP